ncbi:hypothetical protein PGT21_000699 [Puccinia graminis f. sp. tritici]|uniref:DNA 3'-5' helicase n=1 Tax=Puccinia graminis f. sp. tritici TaxID=56615 RepID=A0A5B0N1R1_PUCGR|nr:hypothetical protein PGT21_000699 [Puccinia graminis f. sp. tritici]
MSWIFKGTIRAEQPTGFMEELVDTVWTVVPSINSVKPAQFGKIFGVSSSLVGPVTPVIPLSPSQLAMQALQQFTRDPSPSWKSPFQQLWITAVLEADQDLLVVARTGGGKSLAYLLPPLVEPTQLSVVIQPLKALGHETMKILESHHIEGFYVDQALKQDIPHNTRVLVASVEAASQIGFFTAVSKLKPRRFIIDEAHQYLDDVTYRNYMAGVARLRGITGQFVFMTGSFSPANHTQLLQGIFNMVQVKTFREPTVRPELLWEVKDHQLGSAEGLLHLVAATWQSECKDDSSRGMVFVQSHAGVEALYQQLERMKIPVTYYHAGLDVDLAKSNANQWRVTGRCVMVGTCAFGTGINYPHVRFVIILGIPNRGNINQVFQQAGRAGRDGKLAKIILVSQKKSPWDPDEFTQTLLSPGTCPVRAFSTVLDESPSSCLSLDVSRKCSVCSVIGGRVMGLVVDDTNKTTDGMDEAGLMELDSSATPRARRALGVAPVTQFG